MQNDLTSLAKAVFQPDAIALIGLSSDPKRPSGRPLQFLRREGYKGRVYIVNPRRAEVQGETAWPSVEALPEVPEHAYILLGAAQAEAAVRDCAKAGVKVAALVADGFAEAGTEGFAAQERLVGIAHEHGMRLLGPNSMGIADLHTGTLITVNAIYQEADPLRGRASLISQSGSMMGGLISRARALGIGFSRVAAVGNECDLGVAELGEMMLADANTDVVLLFMETIRNADGLAGMAARAHEMGKAVVAYKLGRSALGAEMAVAHTGALLAEDAVADAFLREIGIARVTTQDGLIEAAPLFAGRLPFARPPKVGVLTTTGGGGATVADRLALEGVAIHPPSPATMAAVHATGLNAIGGPMVDLTMAGAGPEFVQPTVEAMAADPEVDLILSITGSSGRSAPERTIPPLAAADTRGKPLVAFVTPDAVPTLKGFIEAGIPAFRTPEGCADAVGALCRWRKPRISRLARAPLSGEGTVLNESSSLALLAAHGIATAPSVACKVGEAPALPFDYPVVAKVLSEAVPHKTEAGGVVLNISDAEELAAAGHRIKASVEAYQPGVQVTELLLAPMLVPLQEVLIGYRLDAQVGPLVTLAPGGVLVGLYDDKAIRLAPVDLATAKDMIEKVIGLAPIRGHRGLPRGDLDALAQAIVALSSLASHQPAVLEAEANPVMVMASGIAAADALVTLAEKEIP